MTARGGASGCRCRRPTTRSAGSGDTLNEMLARLEVAFTRERAFVSDASHELRTPLAILRTELELALRGRAARRRSSRTRVRSAAEETERLSQLAEDLLVIARSDQGRLPVRPSRLDARRPARAAWPAASRTRARAEERAAARRAAPRRRRSTADRARLEQALANLVDNALRHGGGTSR